jgi:predicted S18 family serine protease
VEATYSEESGQELSDSENGVTEATLAEASRLRNEAFKLFEQEKIGEAISLAFQVL